MKGFQIMLPLLAKVGPLFTAVTAGLFIIGDQADALGEQSAITISLMVIILVAVVWVVSTTTSNNKDIKRLCDEVKDLRNRLDHRDGDERCKLFATIEKLIGNQQQE